MRPKGYLALLILALMLALPQLALAVPVHNFDCSNCHRAGATINEIGGNNVCLDCHGATPQGAVMNVAGATPAADASFVAGDASNLYSNNPAADKQTSHNWAASNFNAAAGASEPSKVLHPTLYGTYGITTGKVACTRCHNVHAQKETNPKLLAVKSDRITPYTPNELCMACHTAFDQATTDHGITSHPIGMNYDGVVAGAPENYRTKTEIEADGLVLLADGSLGCVSCHGVHATDSDATTADGFLGSPGAGDGLMLRHNGPSKEDPNAGIPVEGICNVCHVHESHAVGGGNAVGCMDCHGGHEPQNANFYMLKSTVTLPFVPALGGPGEVPLVYDDLNKPWQDAGNGFCEACHNIPAAIAEHNTGLPQDASYCNSCHTHEASAGSFGGSCNSCHGYAPTTATQGGPTGYAYLDATHDYSLDANYKNESLTGHAKHASTGNYTFDCTQCHSNFTSSGHPAQDNNYQDVAFVGSIAAMNGITPTAYDKTGNGTCATLYCHSDGVNPDRVVAGPNAVTVPSWLNGGSTTCTSCHNTGTSGTATVHNTHTGLTLGGVAVDCGTCHADTWVNATTVDLTTGAHVDGDVDVVFNTALTPTNPMDQVNGTCAVYCHSNGTTHVQPPDWDDVNTGNCGDCHDADGSGDSVVISSGSHGAHLSNGLACDACHTHDGSAFGGDHINGTKDVVADVCLGCHGAVALGTGYDAEPVWGNAGSVTCETCHMGSAVAVINTRGGVGSYMDKSSADSTGHNKTSGSYTVSGNLAANETCTSCHNAAAAGHFDGDSVDDRLVGGFDCNSCHGTINTHQAKSCETCHDVHGSSNIYMVRGTSTGEYTGTVVFTALTGADSYDENDAVNGDDICATCHSYGGGLTTTHNNSTNEGGTHNEGTDCFTCHLPHTDATPFAAGGGDSCDSCHGYPPATAAHTAHAPDAAALDSGGVVYRDGTNGYADASACEYCHDGALLYTYNPSDDRTSGTPGRTNHGAGEATQDGTLGTTVGYTGTNCTSACHVGASGVTAVWTDTSLGCDACHYYATGASLTSANNTGASNTLTGTHGSHFDISATFACDSCHTVPGAADTTHITDRTGADEATKIQGMATALQDEADVLAAILVGGAEADPGNPECNNAACHNPSGGYSATWNGTPSNCDYCHSSTAPITGSHSQHLSAAGTFGINTISCTSCHVDNGSNNAHLDGTVSFTTSPAAMGYTEPDVQGAMGTCTTTTCHNNGEATPVAVESPTWNTPSPDCTICHGNAPATGEHGPHVAETDYVAGCGSCHTAATATTHINNSRNMTFSYTPADGTCSNSCHIVVDGRDWTSNTSLNCADCHTATWIGDMGAGLHAAHTNNTFPVAYDTAAANNSTAGTYQFNCANCHGSTLANHMNGGGAADISLGDYAGGTCNNNACHQNGNSGAAALVANWTTGWVGDDSDTCNNCHGNAPNSGAHSVHAIGIHSEDIYNLAAGGILSAAGTAPSAHGDGATSTVLNCNTCHFSTTTAWGNPYDSRCSSCHNPGAPVSQGDTAITVTNKSFHVNGTKDVVFQNIQFKSKAQLRGDITGVAEINNNWSRNNGYKASSSFDQAKASLSNDSYADANCTNACHNGNPIAWAAPTGDCSKCHTALPQ